MLDELKGLIADVNPTEHGTLAQWCESWQMQATYVMESLRSEVQNV